MKKNRKKKVELELVSSTLPAQYALGCGCLNPKELPLWTITKLPERETHVVVEYLPREAG